MSDVSQEQLAKLRLEAEGDLAGAAKFRNHVPATPVATLTLLAILDALASARAQVELTEAERAVVDASVAAFQAASTLPDGDQWPARMKRRDAIRKLLALRAREKAE